MKSLSLNKLRDMKTYQKWKYSSSHFNLGTRKRWMFSFTHRSQYPFQSLSNYQSRSPSLIRFYETLATESVSL